MYVYERPFWYDDIAFPESQEIAGQSGTVEAFNFAHEWSDKRSLKAELGMDWIWVHLMHPLNTLNAYNALIVDALNVDGLDAFHALIVDALNVDVLDTDALKIQFKAGEPTNYLFSI